MKTYIKKVKNILCWLFIIFLPIWLIISEAEGSNLIFGVGFIIAIIFIVIFGFLDI